MIYSEFPIILEDAAADIILLMLLIGWKTNGTLLMTVLAKKLAHQGLYQIPPTICFIEEEARLILMKLITRK